MILLSVFLGGGLGASFRYLLSQLASKLNLESWLGTFAANAIGCLIFFLVWKYFGRINKDFHYLLKIGFLGGLTTFSTFAFEVASSFSEGRYKEGVLILSLNMFVGIVVGVWIIR